MFNFSSQNAHQGADSQSPVANGEKHDAENIELDGSPAGDRDGSKGKTNLQKSDGEKKPDEAPSKLNDPKVRWALLLVGIVLLMALAVWFTWYWTTARFRQSTDDAFLQADQVVISSKIPGYVEEVLVAANQDVAAGQPLARINSQDAKSGRDQALAQVTQTKAVIGQIEAQIRQQRTQVVAADAQVRGARTTLDNAQLEFERYRQLSAVGAQTEEQLTQKRQIRDQAAAQLAASQAQGQGAVRQVDTLHAQIVVAKAQVQQAEAQLRKTEEDLGFTTVRSSIAGRVGDKAVRVGQYVQPNTRLMSIVPVQDIYLVANFKETQIGLMRVGQPAIIELDALIGEKLHGTVESFSPGTGAEFALLPPQNATGNFTKVVQRVPVRIHVDDAPEARRVLLPGLSVNVTVDTIGAKDYRKRVEREADRRKDERKNLNKEAVRRDRTNEQPGPGR